MREPTYRLQLYQAGEVSTSASTRSGASVKEQAGQIDVHRDGRLEERVVRELQQSEAVNLLAP